MSELDIRWEQRFSNFCKAFDQLERAVKLASEKKLSELEQQGLIQGFEFTHELAWKTMKDFIESKGNTPVYGSKDATREAFQLGLISDGETWMEMIQSRNESSHTYNRDTAEKINKEITGKYYALLLQFKVRMAEMKKQ
jgi:nucleotidyltransferase substrate binding protein (TIGR01987 family)